MASMSPDGKGRWRVRFRAPDGRSMTLRLGRCARRDAQALKGRVEYLLSALVMGFAHDAETSAWLAKIPDRLHSRLERVGLVLPRAKVQLGPFLAAYIAGRTDVKYFTRRNMLDNATRLTEFFGEDQLMDKVTEADAERWFRHLLKDYARATVGRTVKRARQFWAAAMKQGAARTNPFKAIKAPSQVNRDRAHFITEEMAAKVLDACPSGYWRLVFALSRYGGMRCPSEHMALKWEDVLWDQNKIVVRAPKTGTRIMPLFSELRPHLEQAWDEAPEGTVYVLDRRSAAKLRANLERIIARAGLKQWERLFHNLKASRQTELCNRFPAHVVAAWLGNSVAVAQQHYLQLTEDHYRAAAAPHESGHDGGPRDARKAQIPTAQAPAPGRITAPQGPLGA